MTNIVIFCIIFLTLPYSLKAQEQLCHAYIDLTHNSSERLKHELKITLKLDAYTEKIVKFNFPKSIQGTYSFQNYSRFISFKTIEENVQIQKKNDWFKATSNTNINTLNYTVKQAWNESSNTIFEPASTRFSEDVIFLNWWAILPKFKDKNMQYLIHLNTEKDKFISSSTLFSPLNDSTYISDTLNYTQLLDQSLLYSDQESLKFVVSKEMQAFIGTYSATGKISPYHLYKDIYKTLSTLCAYIPQEMLPKVYTSLFYFNDQAFKSGKHGALEHKCGAVFTLPESNYEHLRTDIQKTLAHEFLHLITPLTLSNTDLQHYDTQKPNIGKHLWFYEGMTEYLAIKLLWQTELISDQHFISEILEKYNRSLKYNDKISLAHASEKVLDKYKTEFGNFYNKGFLLSLCLDIYLKKQHPTLDLIKLLQTLAKDYPNGFEDKQLFKLIEEYTQTIGTKVFLEKIVVQNDPLPLTDFLAEIGISFSAQKKITEASLGNIGLRFEHNQVLVDDVSELDHFGKSIGFQKNDILYSLNDHVLNTQNFEEQIGLFKETNSNHPVKIQIIRDGKWIEKKAKTGLQHQIQEASIELNEFRKNDFFKFKHQKSTFLDQNE